MAITITAEPQLYSPGSNPCEIEFSSDQTLQPNFSYVVEFWVNGALHSKHAAFPTEGTLSKWNAEGALRTILKSPIILGSNLSYPYNKAYCSYHFVIREKYGTTPTLQANITSPTYKAFNAALEHPDFIDFQHTDYLVSNENNNALVKFLTYFPRNKSEFVAMDEVKFMAVLTDTTNLNFNITLINAAGQTVAQDSAAGGTFTVEDVNVFRVDPTAILANVSSIDAADFGDSYKYVISIQDAVQGTYQGSTELYEFIIDTDVCIYEKTRLHWLNKLGGWDSYTFKLPRTDSKKARGTSYEKSKGEWNDNGTDVQHRYLKETGQRVSSVRNSEKAMALNSEYLCHDVYNWLGNSIIDSPSIFMEINGGFEPVQLTTDNFVNSRPYIDKLTKRELKLNFNRTYLYRSQHS